MDGRTTTFRRALALSAGLIATAVLVASPPGAATSAPEFKPLAAPQRIVDTRAGGETADGKDEGKGLLRADGVYVVEVAGRAGVDPGAVAATLNVTAVAGGAAGHLTVYPCDQKRPTASNVNYAANAVVPNAVFTSLDSKGRTCIHTHADVHLVVDVNGWMPAGVFEPLPKPLRYADTRPGAETADSKQQGTGKVGAGQTVRVDVAGRLGIDKDAAAVVLNVTVVEPDGPGHFTVYPCGAKRPTASNLNYAAGQVVANSAVAPLDHTGSVCVFTHAAAHVIVDVSGSLTSVFVGLDAPARLVDSRSGSETIDGDVQADGFRRKGTTLQFPVAGRAKIPAGATAVALTVTAVAPAEPGYLTLYPRNAKQPHASNVNYMGGNVVANTVIAGIGGGGMVCLFTSADTEVIVDVAGYFVGNEPTDSGKDCEFEFPVRSMWDGYPVGEYHLRPGRYISPTPASSKVWCETKRRSHRDFMPVNATNILYGHGVAVEGPIIVDVKNIERWVDFSLIWGTDSVRPCAPLRPWVAPKGTPTPKTTFGAGDYVVGVDIEPGTYSATSLPMTGGCVIQRVSSFDGASSSTIERIPPHGEFPTTVKVVIKRSDLGVRVSNTCTTFK